MNVWVDSIAALDIATEPTSGQQLAHMSMLGEDWYLVRRDAGAMDRDGERCWHPANDELAGTEYYGVNDASPTGSETFTIRFDVFAWSKMLLASGDLSMYVEMDRATIESCTTGQVDGQWRPEVLASSTRQQNVLQYCRSGVSEDPWISAAEHPDHIVYGPLDYRAAARTLFLRPYLAHFFPFFRHFFAVFSVLTPGFQNVAPKDRGHAA